MLKGPIEQIETLTQKTNDYMETRFKSTFSRYPLLFSLLTAFGIVSVLHGFESAISYIPYLNERPLAVFALGIVALIFTGSLYKALDKKRID